jgi:hypothetical protein
VINARLFAGRYSFSFHVDFYAGEVLAGHKQCSRRTYQLDFQADSNSLDDSLINFECFAGLPERDEMLCVNWCFLLISGHAYV